MKLKVDRKSYGLWIIVVAMLAAAMVISPDLWAASDQSPRRQTVPPGTLTPTSKPPKSEPSRPTNPPPSPTPTVPVMPTFTLTAGIFTATLSSTVVTTDTPATASATPTEKATATPEIQADVSKPSASLTAESTPTIPPVSENSPTPTPGSAASAQVESTGDAADDAAGVSPLLWGGVVMVVAGLALLAVWRLRA